MKKSKNDKNPSTPSSDSYSAFPETSFDMVNKYGRCEIQPTADTDNLFPQIAQGLPKKRCKGRTTQNTEDI